MRGRRWTAILLVGGVQLVLSGAFAATVRHPVFDEPYYAPDVTRYESSGVSLETLRRHATASGPVMTIAAGLAGRLGPGDLRYGRIAVLAFWAAALVVACFLAQRSEREELAWALALLFCFPHVPTSMGSLLTEGPTTAAILGALAFTVMGLGARWSASASAWASGACVGLAVLTRQYALALSGAIAGTWLVVGRRWAWAAAASAGTAAALGGYLLVWHGLLAPNLPVPDDAASRIALAVGALRPVEAIVYAGLYLAPVVVWRRVPRLPLVAMGSAAVAAALAMADVRPLGQGPVLSAVVALGRGHHLAEVALTAALVAIAFTAVVSVFLGAAASWRTETPWRDPVWVFSAAAVLLFVAEQVPVGGPYFERYHLVVFPWATYLSLRVFGVPARRTALFGFCLFAMGQAMLWRRA